ncbi:MAG: NAD+ synthase [Desulfatibacillaceae bacterium]
MKIALVQLNTVIGDFTGNVAKLVEAANKARDMECDLAVASELALCGYPPRDLLERTDFIRACTRHFEDLVASVHGIGMVCGFVDASHEAPGELLNNAAALFEDGKVLHVAHKRLLPTYDVFDERRYFSPGEEAVAFPYKGRKLGLTVCEDAWNVPHFFPKPLYKWDPVEALVRNGADLVVNIAASPFHAGKRRLRQNLMAHIARTHGVQALYVNQVGGNDSLLFDGASTAHGPDGELLAQAGEFVEDLVCFDTETGRGELREVPESDVEAVYDALIMGVRDYFAKCGFTNAVVGLSGGIDSALTLCIAIESLGPKNLATIFMPSDYTSRDNFRDTQELADNLGVAYNVVPITSIYKAYLRELGGSAKNPGVTEQNIQARIRGNILMAHSNRHGALVLSTGNKSELAVGYSTLYGDMAGGMSVISDVPKKMVYELCRHINREREIIPQNILDKAPSAELKPDQTDQDDLPPYDILDGILAAYVEDHKEPREIVEMGYDKDQVADVVRRIRNNEYKRRQAAPGLKITPKAFGEGRRYPIAHKYREDL